MINPVQRFTGEVPRTTFRNMEQAMKVEVLSVHEPRGAMHEMVQATHSASPPQPCVEDVRIDAALTGAGLWMLQEVPQLEVRITGCSRIFSHQFVRARVGITILQQCTGDIDLRHADVIVPGCVAEDSYCWFEYLNATLRAKDTYVHLLDAGVPIQSARYVLPHGITTYLYASMALSTAMAIYQKRHCTMNNTWEMVLFARRFKTAILAQRPAWAPLFESTCTKGTCWHAKGRTSGAFSNFWRPDAEHDNYRWLAEDFIHPGTNAAISSPTEHRLPVSYVGLQEVK